MGCPCLDPLTGEIKIVSAKIKEMIYRMQSPIFKEEIEKLKIQELQGNVSVVIGKGGSKK